jgi:hypothetical protein
VAIFGPDLSSFQAGVNVATLPDPFVLAKCTEGNYYADADYNSWREQAAGSGKIFIAYHFVKAESSPQAQASWLAAHIGNLSVPVMLDVEMENTSRPGLPQVLAVADAMKTLGLNVRLAYLPKWFWSQIGSPNLSPLTVRGIGLIASSYPGGTAYPGDNASGWQPYGGVTPMLWQFTDSETDHGQHVGDYNAYRGTRDQLAVFLGGHPVPAPSITTGTDVNLTDMLGPVSSGMAAIAPDAAAEQMGAGATFSVAAALEGTAVRQAETLILVKRILSAVGQPPAVDVAAIADQITASIVQHLATGVDVQAVAVAVQNQLAQALGGHAAG